METYMANNFPSFRVVTSEMNFRGPRSNREMTKSGFIEVATNDSRRLILQSIKDKNIECKLGNTVIRVRAAKSQADMRRDWVLRKACDEVKHLSGIDASKVAIAWPERAVKVGDATVFKQGKRNEGDGEFTPEIAGRLPENIFKS